MFNFKKIINYSEVSEILTGSRNVIRMNRPNVNYSPEMNELFEFLDEWVLRNSKLKETKLTIKTK